MTPVFTDEDKLPCGSMNVLLRPGQAHPTRRDQIIIPKEPGSQLKLLAEFQLANMRVPLLGNRTLSIDCEPGSVGPPLFEVQCYPGQFQPEELDLAERCIISFKAGQLIQVIHVDRHAKMTHFGG